MVFNLANAHERELYEWCIAQSGNFNSFVKAALWAYKNRAEQPAIVSEPARPDDADLAKGIF